MDSDYSICAGSDWKDIWLRNDFYNKGKRLIMFKIIEGDFRNSRYSNEEYLDNWPMLYMLENGKQAYIGESNDNRFYNKKNR